jgi:anti-sigma factor RsiW
MSEIPTACAEYAPDLSALLDGELCGERETEVRGHAESCARCAARLEALRRVDGLLAGAPMPAVPSDLRARLGARIAREAPERARGRRAPWRLEWKSPRAPWLGGLAAAAAAALLLYLGVVPGGAPPEVTRVEVAESTPVETAETPPAAAVEVAESAAPTAPVEVAEAEPEAPRRAAPVEVAESAPVPSDLEAASDEELALVLEIETIEDLDVIANLDLLERMLSMEEGAG